MQKPNRKRLLPRTSKDKFEQEMAGKLEFSFRAEKGGGGGSGVWEERRVLGVEGTCWGGEEEGRTPTSILVGIKVSGRNYTLNHVPRV